MGPLAVANLADSESTPCFSGRETEELSLELPDGKRVAQLPKDTRIDNEHIHYQTHWAATNRLAPGPCSAAVRCITSGSTSATG